MKLENFEQLHIPDNPGVYLFYGSTSDTQPLYIGRATSLRDRVRSYFGDDLIHTRGPLLVDLVTKAETIKWQETDSVLEAIILEANLIKKYQPYYNTKEKDNKSFNYVVITKEDFPRILVVRERNLEKDATEKNFKVLHKFGPYPHTGTLVEVLKIIRKMFPYRDKCTPNSGKPCFNRQIGLCPGVCNGDITSKEYKKSIARIVLFFEGKRSKLIADLEKDMTQAAHEECFEKATSLRGVLYKITHIHDMAILKDERNETSDTGFRIEAYDVAHLGGTNIAGVMVVAHDGILEKGEYRKFKITTAKNAHETQSLREILTRRFSHPEWRLANIIVVDGNDVQKNAAEAVLAELKLTIPVLAVVKDARHKPRDFIGDPELITQHRATILKLNAEAHRFSISYHRLLRSRIIR
ncbi:MAG: GIY-YIG nuclease family protein [Candidatus Taylorbacteria bacterium]|nr:GIY-YIG nuclease family protein [Candidatus Taylorbacteria bacterium]